MNILPIFAGETCYDMFISAGAEMLKAAKEEPARIILAGLA